MMLHSKKHSISMRTSPSSTTHPISMIREVNFSSGFHLTDSGGLRGLGPNSQPRPRFVRSVIPRPLGMASPARLIAER